MSIEKDEQYFPAGQFQECLRTERIARQVLWKEEIDSTNNWAREYAGSRCWTEEGTDPDGTLFVAEKQTGGKGRQGRIWTSPPGENIYMSLLLWKPEIKTVSASQLTLIMGLSVAQGIEALTGRKAGIKWPNDVVYSGKKICGILTEMRIQEGKPEHIVIGVGINVNQTEFSPELQDKATSVFLETGKKADRIAGIARVMECFEKNYRKFLRTEDLSLIREDYESLLLNKDRQVRIIEKRGQWQGTARGINEQGELLVEDCQGNLREILSGEVSVRGLYSYV